MLAIIPLLPMVAPASARYLITPGAGIGRIQLGQDIDKVMKKIGQPTTGDAAMGRYWNTWTSKSGARVDVYAQRVGDGTHAPVRVVRVTSNSFHLANGDHTGYSLRIFKKQFPSAKLQGSYPAAHLGKVEVWDDRKHGVTFEALKGVCVAIAVHKKGRRLDGSYIPYVGEGGSQPH